MDLYKLFNIDYLFYPYPAAGFSWPVRIILLAFFVATIIMAIWAGKKSQQATSIYKKAWRKWQIWGWSSGIIGLSLVIFREIDTIYLSSRIWLLLWILAVLVWLGFIIKYWKQTVPAKAQAMAKEAEFKKWLPKK